MSLEKLKHKIPDGVFTQLSNQSIFANITPLRLAHFLAQCDYESGGFKHAEENLNYSGDGLLDVFPKYFDARLAKSYAHLPQKIGSRVYADRMGNGDEKSGEGYLYRGRGYLQITGKINYVRLGQVMGVDFIYHPELVSSAYPLASAAWFFDDNRLWEWCDVGATEAVVKNITRKINGGTNGLEDRVKLFNKYWAILK